MKTAFTKSFAKDLKKHADNKKLLARVQEIIMEVEAADSLTIISNLKRLKAEGRSFRIRVGDYRIGLIVDGDIVTFVRVLKRSEVYRYFP